MKDYICIVGGANIDISSKAFSPLIINDSNPSEVSLAFGGVARNIANNLALLGAKIEFLTVFGNDAYAEQLKNNCISLGIGISHALQVNALTSTYLCINDEKGDMYIAASDMRILSNIDITYLKSKQELLNNAKAIVIDTNLSKEALEFVINSTKVPVFVETVSANKTKKLIGTRGAFAVTPNKIEAEMLAGIKINEDQDLYKASEILHKIGYEWVIITLGERGAFYSDKKINGIEKSVPSKIVNTTGAGDSFFAALVYGYINGMNIKEACRLGNAAASITISCASAVNSDLSVDKLISFIKG